MKLLSYLILFAISSLFIACNNEIDEDINPETLSEFHKNMDEVILTSQENIQTWYRYPVPNVNGYKKIVKKEGRFLSLVNAKSPSAKVLPTTGSRLQLSYDGLHWEDMNVELPGGYQAIVATKKYFYAVGHSLKNREKGSVIRSIDGFFWEEVLICDSVLFDIIETKEGMFAVGLNGQIAHLKEDGMWVTSTLGQYGLFDLVYGNKLLITGDPYALFSDAGTGNFNLIKHDFEVIGLRHSLYHEGLYLFFSSDFVLRYDGTRFYPPRKKSSTLNEVVYQSQFVSLDEDVLASDDGLTWTKIAELEVVDQNITGLDTAHSFISGSDIIFTQKY